MEGISFLFRHSDFTEEFQEILPPTSRGQNDRFLSVIPSKAACQQAGNPVFFYPSFSKGEQIPARLAGEVGRRGDFLD